MTVSSTPDLKGLRQALGILYRYDFQSELINYLLVRSVWLRSYGAAHLHGTCGVDSECPCSVCGERAPRFEAQIYLRRPCEEAELLRIAFTSEKSLLRTRDLPAKMRLRTLNLFKRILFKVSVSP